LVPSAAIGTTATVIGTVTWAGKALTDYNVYVDVVGTASTLNGTTDLQSYDMQAPNTTIPGLQIGGTCAVASGWSTFAGSGIVSCGPSDRTITVQVRLTQVTAGTYAVNRGQITVTSESGAIGPAGLTGPQGPDVTLVQSSYAYLALASAGNTSGAWNIITWAVASPPASFLNNFTLAGSNQRVTASQAGRYRVQVEASVNNSIAMNYAQLRLEQFNSIGSLIAQHDLVGTQMAAAGWTSPSHEAQFSMSVGDYIVASWQPNGAGATISTTGTSISIIPVGGSKGDVGPSVVQAQSSYFYAQASSSTPAMSANTQNVIWWLYPTIQNNGFTFNASGTNIIVTQAGKYRVAAQISGYSGGAGTIISTQISHLDSTATVKATRGQNNPLGANGMWTVATGETILDCAVGDIIQIFVNPNAAFTINVTSSWLEITPVGGTKGDPGPPGGTFDGFRRRASTAYVIPTTTVTELALPTTDVALGSTYTPDGTSTRISIPATGVYDVTGWICTSGVVFPAGSFLAIRVNGVVAIRSMANRQHAYESITISGQLRLNQGDQVALAFYHEAGSNFTLGTVTAGTGTDPTSPAMAIWRAGSGPQGASINVKGTVTTYNTLPLTANINDTWLASDSQHLWTWNGSVWVDMGSIFSSAQAQQFSRVIGIAYGSIAGLTLSTTYPGTEMYRISNVFLRAGVRYRGSVNSRAFHTNGDWAQYVRLGMSTATGPGTVTASLDAYFKAGQTYGAINWEWEITVSVDGIYTLGVGGTGSSTTCVVWTDGGSRFMLEDLSSMKGDPGAPGLPGSATNVGGSWFGAVATTPAAPGTDVTYTLDWATTRATSFTLAGSNRQVVAQAQGRYQATLVVAWNGSTAAVQYTRAGIIHYNAAGTQQAIATVVGPGGPASTYLEATAVGQFDMQIGDYLTFTANIANAVGIPLGGGSSFASVIPVGGAKGDKGDKGDPGGPVGPPGPDQPTGVIQAFAGSTAPTNYLMCDGAARSRTTYAALFAVCGTAYGAGDGSTTFNVPNLNGRVPVGRDGGYFAALGQAGGTTVATMPSHNHSGYTGASDRSLAHQHSSNFATAGRNAAHYHNAGNQSTNLLAQGGAGTLGVTTGPRSIFEVSAATGTESADHAHSVSGWTDAGQGAPDHLHGISAQGSGDNVQPYLTVNYIIRT
jgi:microcystin-dependent protein